MAPRRTSDRLADGREIIYFDLADDAARDAVDLRDLPPSTHTSQLRYDRRYEEWVVIASHRQGRTHLPPTDSCPLCPSVQGRRTEIPASDYDVVAFENRFPSLVEGTGRCEVVCFSSDHEASFADLPVEQARLVVDAWADRTEELQRLPEVAQVFCFENRGEEIGVTLSHPHGQIYGYPFVTPRTERALAAARRHLERTGRHLHAELLAEEQATGERVVLAAEHWTAFVPSAARWPVEVHLYSHRQVPDLPALTDAERDELAVVYRRLLRGLDRLYDAPLPYIAAWYQAPARADRELAHLHLELFSVRRAESKLKFLAGSESGMGVFINDVTPEAAAQRLREVIDGTDSIDGTDDTDGMEGVR